MRAWKWLLGVAVLLLVATLGFSVGRVSDGDGRWAHMADGRAGGPAGRGMGGLVDEEEFLVEMVAHHQEAIDAAGELARSDRPAMRQFGEDVVAVQSAQVAQMTRWLERWYGGGGEAGYEPMMRDLTGLDGDELDETFLVDMVAHHRTAVMMAQHALVRGDLHPAVASLARDIRDHQRREIWMMLRWLDRWFDTSAMMPMRGH